MNVIRFDYSGNTPDFLTIPLRDINAQDFPDLGIKNTNVRAGIYENFVCNDAALMNYFNWNHRPQYLRTVFLVTKFHNPKPTYDTNFSGI